MTYHEPEHLTRYKDQLIEAIRAVNFQQNPDHHYASMTDLKGQMLEVVRLAGQLCEHIGDEIDSHHSSVKAGEEAKEQFEGVLDLLKHNIIIDEYKNFGSDPDRPRDTAIGDALMVVE